MDNIITDNEAKRKRLIWRCRRGTRELDRMMLYFLQHHYHRASTECQTAFANLLELPDPDLHDILTGARTTENSAVAEIGRIIRQNVSGQSKSDAYG